MAKQHAIEQQHLFATAAAGIGTWSWNLITGELHWSDCYREILGLPPEAEASDKLFLEGVHPFDRPVIEQNRKQIRASDKDTFDLEYRILKGASRIERWINAKGRADRSHDGTVVRMRGIAQDITARKNAERERDELHHQLMQAQEQERKRLSHELHDQTGQSLVGTMLELREIESIVSGIAGDRLRVVRAQLELMSKKLHHLAWELRPPSIDELGLAYAIANYCSEWSALCGIKSDFHCEQAGLDGVPADIQTTIYRSIQECLTNVAKHASGAKSASIIIDRINTDLSVTIEDDGCGFNSAPTTAASITSGWLARMRHNRKKLVQAWP
jgi:signal transduction histidine kinase